MFCTQCGKENKTQSAFCTNCGFKFNVAIEPKVFKKKEGSRYKGRLDLKSIKFFKNPILDIFILIIFIISLPFIGAALPVIVFVFLAWAFIKSSEKK